VNLSMLNKSAIGRIADNPQDMLELVRKDGKEYGSAETGNASEDPLSAAKRELSQSIRDQEERRLAKWKQDIKPVKRPEYLLCSMAMFRAWDSDIQRSTQRSLLALPDGLEMNMTEASEQRFRETGKALRDGSV